MNHSPKLLINASLLLVAGLAFIVISAILYPPYSGFMMEEIGDSGTMRVSSADQWVLDAGLAPGDRVTSITNNSGQTLLLGPQYFQRSSTSIREYFPTRNDRLRGLDEIYQILSDDPIVLNRDDGTSVSLSLEHQRPISSLSAANWALILMGVSAPFVASLAWAWQPGRPETILLLLNGIGYFMFNLNSSVSVYNLEMFYPPLFMHWLIRATLDFGQLVFTAFGTAVLLYYPNKLTFADKALKLIIAFVVIYPVSIYLYAYWTNRQTEGNLPGFGDSATYFHMFAFFGTTVYLCWRQYRESRSLPVQRAQTLWIILAWTIGPGIYVLFRGVPELLDITPLLRGSIPINSLIFLTYLMILIGVARVNLFHLEQYIGQAYQWALVSILFFGLDFLLVSLANVSAGVASAIVIAAVLWGYLPLRQWFHQRFQASQLLRSQELFNDAVLMMVKNSLDGRKTPRQTWERAMTSLFNPAKLQEQAPPVSDGVAERGQCLMVQGSKYAPPLQLEYADGGARLFNSRDLGVVKTLAMLYEKLFDLRDAFLAGQTQERNRIRRDLHDQIGHKLLSLIYTAKDDKSRTLAQETITQLSELIHVLKHEPIYVIDLATRIQAVCEDACEEAGLRLEWQQEMAAPESHRMSSDQFLNVLNIIREFLSNTIKHANASNVSVQLQCNDSMFTVDYADDGCGFVPKEIKPGNGLFHLQARSEELHARMEWDTTAGTRIKLQIPLATEEGFDA